MDKKAKQILFNTYWSSRGWKEDRSVAEEDFEYAKSKGIMFDPVYFTHDELGQRIFSKGKEVNKQAIVDSFIASLSTRALQYRSFLSSYALARVFSPHKFQNKHQTACDICQLYEEQKEEYDYNVLNFEKLKWGGVRLMQLPYVNLDLEQALNLEALIPQKEDYKILGRIKEAILTSAENDRPRQLEKRLAKIIKSNANEREGLLNIFGICGILETVDQQGFYHKFIPAMDREIRPVNKTDWDYPVDWWQGKFGVNEEAWNFYFG